MSKRVGFLAELRENITKQKSVNQEDELPITMAGPSQVYDDEIDQASNLENDLNHENVTLNLRFKKGNDRQNDEAVVDGNCFYYLTVYFKRYLYYEFNLAFNALARVRAFKNLFLILTVYIMGFCAIEINSCDK
uniref:Uncharacterized protein LOC114347855 n=1 Tax=Diabrotica virgifera virgifera TaxID=50390 RepID=A0A6P7H6Y9_DIAVI